MLSDIWASQRMVGTWMVLILVLMEYALWLLTKGVLLSLSHTVLILVLMEYALWRESKVSSQWWTGVLILVLMEYALWLYYDYIGTS